MLCFGRLLAYKGLDLLAEALRLLGSRQDMEVRVVGQGPESTALATLRALPGVTVENRWVPEGEMDALGVADADCPRTSTLDEVAIDNGILVRG